QIWKLRLHNDGTSQEEGCDENNGWFKNKEFDNVFSYTQSGNCYKDTGCLGKYTESAGSFNENELVATHSKSGRRCYMPGYFVDVHYKTTSNNKVQVMCDTVGGISHQVNLDITRNGTTKTAVCNATKQWYDTTFTKSDITNATYKFALGDAGTAGQTCSFDTSKSYTYTSSSSSSDPYRCEQNHQVWKLRLHDDGNDDNTCDYPYFKLTANETGTEFFKYVNSATTGGTEATWNARACAETPSCKNGVNASGSAEISGSMIYNKISSSSETCVDNSGITRYESVCNGSRSGCGNKKTISACESFDYITYIQGKQVPVIGRKSYNCGSCDTSRGYYDTESSCKSSNSNKACILSSGCYQTKCKGYYDTLAECENGKAADATCGVRSDGCYERISHGYFDIRVSHSFTKNQDVHCGNLGSSYCNGGCQSSTETLLRVIIWDGATGVDTTDSQGKGCSGYKDIDRLPGSLENLVAGKGMICINHAYPFCTQSSGNMTNGWVSTYNSFESFYYNGKKYTRDNAAYNSCGALCWDVEFRQGSGQSINFTSTK
ncbi:MAG: hypothetical protein NC311_17000, partial [Muribaculaceae bacterium]|nr:hypothetical protein [Muribaculaceae bacterium]